MTEREENIIKRIQELSLLLGGSCQQMTTSNSMGRTSKKIVIEYDVQQTK